MKTTILRLLFALLLVSMLLTSQSIRPAYAASYVVNSLGDAVVNDSACTLREAILAANNAPANANCGPGSAGNDTITFSVSGTIPLSLNLPDIVSAATAGALTINGGGNITISSNYAGQVMVVNIGANLTLQNLTIANGNTSGFGGGIYSAGTLNVTNSTFSNNSASAGGGIYNFNGTLTVTDSTFSNNSASSGNGGGILNTGTLNVSNSTFSANSANFGGGGIYNTGTLNMSNSTVSANSAILAGGGIYNNGTLNVSSSTFSTNSASAGHGGGIYNGFISTLNVSNSTFSNNSANSSLGGGGIFNDEATLNVTNSSFSGNSAPFGGGIRNSGGTATLNNTLIANSASGGDCVTSVPLSGANINNLIEDSTSACGLTHGVNGNLIGFDPNLGALTGSPAYFPLNPGSLAIDAGDNPTCAAAPVNNQSQNGVTRPQDGDDSDSTATCDIGSYEAIFPKLTATKTNTVGGAITLGNSFTWKVTVANTGIAGATFAAGHTILRDDLPAGATYGAPTVQNLVGVSGSGSITCNMTSNVLICYAGGGPVTLGATTSQFDVVFSVTPTAAGALTNPASGGVCRADPFGAIVESSESNNDCADSVTVDDIPDLTAAKRNNTSGAITLGNSFTWTVTVANTGPAAATFASGQTILRDNLPGGPTYGAPTVQNLVNVSGSITCHTTFNVLICTASGGSVTLGATTGAFDVAFSVTPTATGALTNPASGGVCWADPLGAITESSEINNGCADTVTVGGVPDLTAAKSNNVGGAITVGNPFTWTVAITNIGSAGATFTSGQTILRDDLPTGLTYGAPMVQNLVDVTGSITCTITFNVLICYAGGGSVTLGATTGAFDVAFSVTPTATGALTNPASGGVCRADPFGAMTESSESNNDCADTVTVTAPDLTATKSNNVSGAITLGSPFTWTVTVANTGATGAIFAAGQTILRDDLPSGPIYGAPTVQNLLNVSGSGAIACAISSGTLTCTASGGPVTLGATTGAFDVAFSVTPTATGALTNPASGGVCRADPDNNITESSEINNDCADTVTVGGVPDLTAIKSNNVSGSITVGNSFTWKVKVANSGAAGATFTSGQTILRDDLPSGPIYGAPTVQNPVNVSGSGAIACAISSGTLTCTASGGPVTLGATTGAFDVAFSVTPTTTGALTNPASGGVCRADPDNNITESSEINNDCADTVTVGGVPDLTAIKSNNVGGAITVGNPFTWTVAITNIGAAGATFTSGQTILRDDLPSGPIYGAPTVQNLVDVTGSITCTITFNVLICYASGGSVTLGATTGAFDVAFSVTPTATGALTNPASGGICRVDPNGAIVESSESNNDCASNTVTVTAPDLTATKSNNVSGAITLGNPFTWTVTVANTGATGATFAAGQTILRDDLPSGPIYGAPTVQNLLNVSGSGAIACAISSGTLTCTASGGPVTLGATTGAFDVAFSVTPTATGALTNPTSGGVCRVDPNGAIVESSESNNDCASNTVTVTAPDLTATKSNNVSGAITLGNPFTWTVTVANTGATGATFAAGQTILRDDLPAGPTYGAPTVQNLVDVIGSIGCTIASNVLTCIASGGPVTLGATTGAFDVAFSVTPTVTGVLTNPASGGVCRADPNGAMTESSEINNDCADTVTVGGVPDLTAIKSNNVSGSITVGNSFTWKVKVANSGAASATFTSGQTILRDDLPSGPIYGAPTVQNPVNVSGSGTIVCAISSGTLTCTASGGPVTLGATTGAFDVAFSVTPTATGALTNPASGGVCRADPEGVIVESSESNNDCADTVTVGGVPDLTAAKSNNVGGAITVGNPFTWTVAITNIGAAGATFTSGQTILRDDLPTGLTYGAPTVQNLVDVTGSITCTITFNVLICYASGGSVTLGATTGAFDVAFSVTPTTTGALTNPASGGVCRADPDNNITESSEINNDCADTVTVGGVPDLTAAKSNNVGGAITVGNPFTWTVTVANIGAAGATFTSGQTILRDDLPTGLTYGAPTVQNLVDVTGSITCTITFNVLICYASGGSVTLGATTGAFDVVFSVTPTVTGALTNPASGGVCRADPDGVITESSESNNDCADTVTVNPYIVYLYLPLVVR